MSRIFSLFKKDFQLNKLLSQNLFVRKSLETSLIISLRKENFPNLAVLREKKSTVTKFNFNFQKWGFFGSNYALTIGGFFRSLEVLGSNSLFVIDCFSNKFRAIYGGIPSKKRRKSKWTNPPSISKMGYFA